MSEDYLIDILDAMKKANKLAERQNELLDAILSELERKKN